jgi:hypothetical protein
MKDFKEERLNVASKVSHSSLIKCAIPFKLGIEPMKRLLIADFQNDSTYVSIEPQLFDDEINGKGLRILVYRTDKMVDVYHQKGVKVDMETFSIGDGIGIIKEATIEPNIFEIDKDGINLHVAFTDKNGDVVEMKIKESGTSKKRMKFLAPVGNDIKHPKQLFLAFMEDFDFVLRKGTVFYARVGDRDLKPSFFPLSRNGEKVFFARYSNSPVVGTINPAMKSPLMFQPKKSGFVEVEGMSLQLQNGKVNSMSRNYKGKNISIEFSKGMANPYELQDGIKYTGRWIYKIDNQIITGGNSVLLKTGNKVDVRINVTQKWIPQNLPLSFQLFTLFVNSFRNWPTTYYWKGKVDLLNETVLDGQWFRR